MGGDGDQLVDNLSCFSQSELGPAVLKASAHINQLNNLGFPFRDLNPRLTGTIAAQRPCAATVYIPHRYL